MPLSSKTRQNTIRLYIFRMSPKYFSKLKRVMHTKLQSVFEDLLKDRLKIGDLWGQKLYVMIVIYVWGPPLLKDTDLVAIVSCVIVTWRDESSGARSPENALRVLPV